MSLVAIRPAQTLRDGHADHLSGFVIDIRNQQGHQRLRLRPACAAAARHAAPETGDAANQAPHQTTLVVLQVLWNQWATYMICSQQQLSR